MVCLKKGSFGQLPIKTPPKKGSFGQHTHTDNDFHKKLRPNTLEGCVVRVSDMIAYAGKDRQDLYRAKLITKEKFQEERLLNKWQRRV